MSGNNVTANNVYGIYLDSSSNNNVLSGNNAINNRDGIWLIYYSSNNILSGNNVTANNEYGIFLMDSSNNSIFHNSFVNNTRQVIGSFSNTIWDDGFPSGGNYWSDYSGADSDLDGIGDSNYTINTGNADRYPLMGMFGCFSATSQYSVQTICNSTISSFSFNGTAISFNVTDKNDTSGFCRICIPTALMNAPYKICVNGTQVSYNLLPCSNSTHSYLYFNYTHSTQEVIVIPEFPSFLILSLFFIATLLAVIVYRKKHDVFSNAL